MKKKVSNSEKISENHIAGINRVVKLEIVIDGKAIGSFKHFLLKQSARRHHNFELTLAHDSLDEVQNHNLEQAQQFLGKRLTIVFKYRDVETESPERTFVGIITKIAFSQEKMSLGNIVLKGYSPTILMDSAPHTQSFGGNQPVNTSIIADRIIKEALRTSKFDFRIETQNKGYINYSSQYCETHYNYLARIAEAYGEQFYYDGEILHFGKLPPHEKPIRLIDGSNISDVIIELKAIHTKPEYFGYNSSSHAKMLGSDNSIKHLGGLSAKAYGLNTDIFKTRSLTPTPINANMFMDVDDSQKSARGSAAVEVFTVSGNTSVPFLYTGCVADLAMRKPDSNQTSHFTTLMITEVTHEVDARGYYSGNFEAIAEGTGFMPKPDFIMPKAEQQVATVISNVDPLNQGRIQVQFDWQLNDTTHFIRMMSPDAGGTDAISQNRGFVAVPEIGDQVMVGFEYHNPDFPFAMGGMFHGKVGLGGGMNNHLKSIQTRSGIKVLMNDANGSVTIQDPSGNIYFMDGGGNINVTAPNKLTMNATDVEINANNNFDINVANNMTSTVGNTALMNYLQKTLMNTPIMLQTVSELFHAQAAKTIINTENELFIQAKEANVAGTQKLFMHSDQNTIVNSKGVVDMHGKQGNNQTNKAQPYKKIPIYMDGRCYVSFRPQSNWSGEYGFDWMRMGDTSLPGDTKANGYKFISSNYNKLKTAYQQRTFTRKDSRGRRITFTYFVPWLTLYPKNEVPKGFTHTSAKLNVTVDIEVEPIRLELEYDKTLFTLDKQNITPVTKGIHKTILNITCIKSFDKYQDIKVISVFKNAKGEEEKALAGKILVTPNKQRYKADCVIVRVNTNINGTVSMSAPSSNRQSVLNKYLRQSLVNPNFLTTIDLSFTSDTDSSGKRTNLKTLFNNAANVRGGMIPNGSTDAIQDFLNGQIKTKYGSKYDDVYKFYFINQEAGTSRSPNYGLFGRSYGIPSTAKSVVIYKGDSSNTAFSDSTLVHEGLHAMGLYHSFDNSGEHTFTQDKTDNIMDYSDVALTPIPVIQLWHWQYPFIYPNVKKI
ncbi:phage baseplate assembly protein V [Chryseobacterium sp. R2ACT005]|uniref:phage baseplate assembly protein V n=1 Tax=Chryseobacterium sp. R2ACT005 TaxID=3416668 RepID=UPI003CE7890F